MSIVTATALTTAAKSTANSAITAAATTTTTTIATTTITRTIFKKDDRGSVGSYIILFYPGRLFKYEGSIRQSK